MCVFLHTLNWSGSGLVTWAHRKICLLEFWRELSRLEQRQAHQHYLFGIMLQMAMILLNISMPPAWEWTSARMKLWPGLLPRQLPFYHWTCCNKCFLPQVQHQKGWVCYIKVIWILTQSKSLLSNSAVWMLYWHLYSEIDEYLNCWRLPIPTKVTFEELAAKANFTQTLLHSGGYSLSATQVQYETNTGLSISSVMSRSPENTSHR